MKLASVTSLVTTRHNRGQVPLVFDSAREALDFCVEELDDFHKIIENALLVDAVAMAAMLERVTAIVTECRRLHIGYQVANDYGQEAHQ